MPMYLLFFDFNVALEIFIRDVEVNEKYNNRVQINTAKNFI